MTKERNKELVTEICQRFRQHGLCLKLEKCEFLKLEIEYLGYILSGTGIKMDPVKVAGVTEWPTPKNLKEVQSFIGFTQFYRRFIKDFSSIARPLHNLSQKGTAFHWDIQQQDAFDNLKKAVTTAPVLSYPEDDKPYLIEADSSGFALGAILSQKKEDGKYHPIAFLSKSLNSAERNYEIYDKEMLSIVRALEEWRYLLEGQPIPITILTDHKALQYFKEPQKLNRRQARWLLYLSRFNFVLQHRPGKNSAKPDALSRHADHNDGSKDNEDIVFLPEKYFIQVNQWFPGHYILRAEGEFVRIYSRHSNDLDQLGIM